MDVEILIHGVPDGQKYYGTKDEQTNMGLFYDNSMESVKFVVETKKQGSTAFVYYSYLRYKGMIEAGGRLGGYFGLTLRLDKYYQDAIHIYNLLEIVFKRYIVGTLLTPSGEGYKYTVPDFASKASDIAQMQQALIQLIQTTCAPNKFLDIDASFIHPISAVPSANIADVSDAAILASIKKYSKVVLSPDYELNIEKEYKKKIQEAEGKGGNIVAEKDKKIAEKDSTITSLNTKVTSQQNQIAVLEQESKRKDTEIQQLKQKGDLAQQVAKIKDPIMTIAEFFRIKNPTPKEPDYGRKNHQLSIINGILTCIVLVVIVVLFLIHKPATGGGSVNPTKTKEYIELKAQYDELLKTYNNLLVQIQKQNGDSQAAAKKAEEERKAAELKAEETRKAEAKKKADDEKKAAEAKKAEEEKKAAEAKKKADDEKKAAEAKKKADDEKKAAEAKKAEEEKKAAETKKPAIAISILPNESEVIIGNKYTFSVSGYNGKGKWTFDGFEPQKGKQTDNTIVVKAKKSSKGDVATATYTPTEGEAKSKSFKYKTK
jgi:hypothetical protein